MSGPFTCLHCAGTGLTDDGGEDKPMQTCPECRGSGERWRFITDPPDRRREDLARIDPEDFPELEGAF